MFKSLLPSSRRHDISFHASGRIDISARIARRLSLAPGDVIDIASDRRGEWYLYVKYRAGQCAGRYHATVWPVNKGHGGSFRTCSRALTSLALSATPGRTILRCPCGEETLRDGIIFITIIWHCSL